MNQVADERKDRPIGDGMQFNLDLYFTLKGLEAKVTNEVITFSGSVNAWCE